MPWNRVQMSCKGIVHGKFLKLVSICEDIMISYSNVKNKALGYF